MGFRYKRYTFKLALTVCLLILPVLAQIDYNEVDYGVHPMPFNRVGTAGFQFLKMPANARSAALGNITTVITYTDANASLTNPANMVNVDGIDVAFNRMNWVADISYQSGALVKNFGNYGAVGLNFIYLNYGDMQRTEYLTITDAIGEIIETPVLDGLGTFSAYDMSLGISYAKALYEKLEIGTCVRYIQEQLDDAGTSTWNFDVGSVYKTGFHSLRVSMLGKFFGPDAEFREYKDRIEKRPFPIKMPMNFAFGAGMEVLDKVDSPHRLTVAAEYNHHNDGAEKINIASEYGFNQMVFLRGGYRFNYDEYGWTLGAGLNYNIKGRGLQINWALIDVGRFSIVQMFSISFHL